jgi:hypothetical protein
MSPSLPFILRPVATTLLMAAIMLVGIVAYRFLPVSALPEVDYLTIQVQTFYPGASPEVMTSSVTSPLDVQFGQMPSLNQMFSPSSAGASLITLQFGLDVSLDIAEQEVQAAINAAGNLLAADLPAPPIYAKVNPADAPILTPGSKTLPLSQVQDLANTRLAQKISQQPRNSQASASLASAAVSGRRCGCRLIRAPRRPTAGIFMTCGPHWATRTSIRRRATSTVPRRRQRSTPTTRSTIRSSISTWSSPIATVPRST